MGREMRALYVNLRAPGRSWGCRRLRAVPMAVSDRSGAAESLPGGSTYGSCGELGEVQLVRGGHNISSVGRPSMLYDVLKVSYRGVLRSYSTRE